MPTFHGCQSIVRLDELCRLLGFTLVLELDQHINTLGPDGIEQWLNLVQLHVDHLHGFAGGEEINATLARAADWPIDVSSTADARPAPQDADVQLAKPREPAPATKQAP